MDVGLQKCDKMDWIRKCDDIINYGATNLITILPCNKLSLFKFCHTKHILFTSNHFVRFQNNFSFVSMCCFLLCSSWTRIFQSIWMKDKTGLKQVNPILMTEKLFKIAKLAITMSITYSDSHWASVLSSANLI